MLGALLSFEGRSGRTAYIGFFVFWIFIFVGLVLLHIFLLPIISAPLMLGLCALMMVSSIALTVRRLHDMGISGWAMAFILFVSLLTVAMAGAFAWFPDDLRAYFQAHPGSILTYARTVVGLFLFVQFSQSLLIFWPGDEGTNRFG